MRYHYYDEGRYATGPVASGRTNIAVADEAATSTTAGSLHRQSCDGYTYCYLGFMADNASAQAVTISAITI